ncbi:MAG TPA: hypothetical protein VJB98_02040 [Candidatus Paceibacterota bacterium]
MQKGNGNIIAIIVIIVVLVVGVFYVWRQEANGPTMDEAIENEIPSDQELSSQEQSLGSQSDSDEISSIEADLQASSFENI